VTNSYERAASGARVRRGCIGGAIPPDRRVIALTVERGTTLRRRIRGAPHIPLTVCVVVDSRYGVTHLVAGETTAQWSTDDRRG
jgi:hypothetical protein